MLAFGFVAFSTNSIFELMTRCSFQGIPQQATCQRCVGNECVSDVVALHPTTTTSTRTSTPCAGQGTPPLGAALPLLALGAALPLPPNGFEPSSAAPLPAF